MTLKFLKLHEAWRHADLEDDERAFKEHKLCQRLMVPSGAICEDTTADSPSPSTESVSSE